MRVLMTVAHKGIDGPIPKLTPLMKYGLSELGADVLEAPYSRRLATQAREESFIRKVLDRSSDLKTLIAKLRQEKPDILFANTTQDWNSLLRDIPMALSAKALGTPVVLLYHGSRSNLLHKKFCLRHLTGFLLSKTSGVLLLSYEELPAFKHYWPQHRYSVVSLPAIVNSEAAPSIPNGYPEHWYNNTDIPVLLFVGRLIPPKGIPEVIEAMQLLLKKIEVRLAVLGEGELYDSLQRRVSDYGLGKVVYFAGYVKDKIELQSWYNVAKCLVLPTYWPEGFPVVVLEAMARGLPIICTRVRGLADRLLEGVNALFVPPRDPEAIATRVIELLENRSIQERMSNANRELIREFEPVTVMRRYLEFFDTILSNENIAS